MKKDGARPQFQRESDSSAAISQPTVARSRSPPHIPDHELLRCIGGGGYGEVWLGRTALGGYHAVKIVHRRTFEHDRPFEREFSGIQKFEPVSRSHEGLVDLLQVGRNDQEGYFYYVMELADAAEAGERVGKWESEKPLPRVANPRPIDPATYSPRTLRSLLLPPIHFPTFSPAQRHRLPLDECIQLGLSLTRALGYLHGQGLVHRDIKPSNIIFVGGVPKLADVGLVAGVSEARSYVGTEGFIPPEGPGSPQADLYSLGIVLYVMSTGQRHEDFPAPLPDLAAQPDHARWLEFNAIIHKACRAELRERYQSAEEMHAELALLDRGQSVKRKRSVERRLALAKKLAIMTAGLALLVTGAWLLIGRFNASTLQRFDESRTIAPAELNSIAILPFISQSPKNSHQYLSDSLTDETINALTNIAGLRVVPRRAVFAFRSNQRDLRSICRQLDVRTVVAGTLKKSSNQLHVTASLLNVADGATLWSCPYDRQLEEIGTIQRDIVEQVVDQLQLQLDPAVLRHSETNFSRRLEAYHFYGEGVRQIVRSTKDGIAQAISCFNRAIEVDPNYALAYCGLADAYLAASEMIVPPIQALAEARNKARRAVEIDDSLSDGHKYLALALFSSFDIAGAEAEFKRAIELGPNYALTYALYARLLRCTGRVKEAGELQRKAQQLDPTDPALPVQGCWQLCSERRFDDALQLAQNYPQFNQNHAQYNSNSVMTPVLLSAIYIGLNRFDEAARELKKVRSLDDDPVTTGSLGYVYGRLGKTTEAHALLRELENLRSNRYVSAYSKALISAGLGETDEAMRQLQLAYEERCPSLLGLKIDRAWNDLRADPRFAELLKKVGLEK